MYNLTEYSKNYSKTTGILWNYYRDETNSSAVGDINDSIRGSKSFDYKTSITGRWESNNTEKRSWDFCAIKIFKQFLEKTRYTIN